MFQNAWVLECLGMPKILYNKVWCDIKKACNSLLINKKQNLKDLKPINLIWDVYMHIYNPKQKVKDIPIQSNSFLKIPIDVSIFQVVI
jgi:hypothetical protein